MTIQQWLDYASPQFTTNKPRLESELILAHVIKVKRIYLHKNPDKNLSRIQLKKANLWLAKRLDQVPLAYLTKRKEFYGRQFLINKHVLVPRPESEEIITQALQLNLPNPVKILDVGCGSGVLGISLAKELQILNKNFELTCSDIASRPLKLTRTNCRKQSIKANFIRSNLMNKIQGQFDIILANLPYLNPYWDFVNGLKHEPKQALFADQNGLAIIKNLIGQLASRHNFYLLLESDISQQAELNKFLTQHQFEILKNQNYITVAFKK